MRFVQFLTKNVTTSRIGVLKNNVVVDLTNEGLSGSPVDVLNQENGFENLISAATKANITYSLNDVKLLAPVTKPDKVLCVGMNYKEHCRELGLSYPLEPIIFSKFSSTIVGPFDQIIAPDCTKALDWEVELVVVIGKTAKNVTSEAAFDHILGYTVGQDISARDLMTPDKNGGQYLLGKSMDTFCPIGPCVLTKDEIRDPHDLKLKTWVNGVLKQNGTTSEMVHRIDKLIEHLSGFMTLYPGDLIMTGTPSGVGYFRSPKEALKVGDLVETEIEDVGRISNTVVKD